MSTSYGSSAWGQPSSPRVRKRTTPYSEVNVVDDPSTIYHGPDVTPPPTAGMYATEPSQSSSSMYSTPSVAAPIGGFNPLSFQGLQAGGTQDVTSGDTSIRSTGPDQTGMYNAYTGLLGTGLQTEAQKSVANTNIQPAMTKLGLQQNEYFPFLKQLISQGGLGGGNSSTGAMVSSVLNAANPAHEQAAINAAEAAAARSAAQSQLNQYGQLAGVAGSPFRYALNAASNAAAVGQSEDAKRKIRDDYAQRRVGNLASAISAQSSAMNPLYSLFGSLLS